MVLKERPGLCIRKRLNRRQRRIRQVRSPARRKPDYHSGSISEFARKPVPLRPLRTGSCQILHTEPTPTPFYMTLTPFSRYILCLTFCSSLQNRPTCQTAEPL